MAIVKMKRLRLIALAQDRDALLSSLQLLGAGLCIGFGLVHVLLHRADFGYGFQ